MKIKSGQNKTLSELELITQQQKVEQAYAKFLEALGYDWKNDTNMEGTPRRVAKMYMREITHGTYAKPPRITAFDNDGKYEGMVFQGNIDVKSLCSHHVMPFVGKAFVAYIPKKDGKIIGLSKLNRIVEYYARRPQLQEQLTQQVHDHIEKVVGSTRGIAVAIEASHMCVALRGVNQDSMMKTAVLTGAFLENENKAREEFYGFIRDLK